MTGKVLVIYWQHAWLHFDSFTLFFVYHSIYAAEGEKHKITVEWQWCETKRIKLYLTDVLCILMPSPFDISELTKSASNVFCCPLYILNPLDKEKLINYYCIRKVIQCFCKIFQSVCLQVETWQAPLYQATPPMSLQQDKAATPPLHSLEWFLVGDTTPLLWRR